MKHCILAKFRPDAGDWHRYLPQIRKIFAAAEDIPGIQGARVYPCCVGRANRYHVMIVLEMELSALPAYDASDMHHRWKEIFGPLLEQKAIFDYEDGE